MSSTPSSAGRQAALEEKKNEILRSTHESKELGCSILTSLDEQSEGLQRSENVLDDAKYTMDMAKRTVRGMTWSGWIANMLTSGPKRSSGSGEDVHKTSQVELDGNFDTGMSSRGEVGRPQNMVPRFAGNQDDLFSQQLHRDVKQLEQMGREMGLAIDRDNDRLDRIADKSDALSRETASTTRQATQLIKGAVALKPIFKAIIAIQDVKSRRFLEVDGVNVSFGSKTVSTSARWKLHTLGEGEDIVGFQLLDNRKWLGVNRLGYLKVQAPLLKSYEYFAVDLHSPSTLIMITSSYLGTGALLCVSDEGVVSTLRNTEANRKKASRFKLLQF